MKKEKVATVTVTYNRKDLLIKNIKAILEQTYKIDCIIVVDNNSTDGTREAVNLEFGKDDRIKYIFLDENIGGAGGFYTGCKYAYENKFDWVILMDDDGRPQNIYTIQNLFEEIQNMGLKSNKKVVLNSLVVCDEKKLSFGLFDSEDTIKEIQESTNTNIIINRINPFNGTLISRTLMEEIGFPNKDFFIKGDEFDYQCRAMKANAYIATVVDSLYYHPKIEEKNTRSLKIFNKKLKFFIEAPWKEYYRSRNYTFSYIRDGKKMIAKKQFFKRITCAIVCKCNKVKTIKMIIKGYKDGKNGRLGNTVKP